MNIKEFLSNNLVFLSLRQRFAFEENKNKKMNRFMVVEFEQNHFKMLKTLIFLDLHEER